MYLYGLGISRNCLYTGSWGQWGPAQAIRVVFGVRYDFWLQLVGQLHITRYARHIIFVLTFILHQLFSRRPSELFSYSIIVFTYIMTLYPLS